MISPEKLAAVRPTDDITTRLDNLAQSLAGEYPPHTLTDLAEAASLISTLRQERDEANAKWIEADEDAKLQKEFLAVADARVDALTAERDEAQSMVQAWDHVFGTIEAHIMDRVNMGDPANPSLYLEIIRSDIANIKRNSDQICAARWADYKRHAGALASAEAQLARQGEALQTVDSLIDGVLTGPDPDDCLARLIDVVRLARSTLSPEDSHG